MGFDYLRDNGMATSREQQVQRGHVYAIVDEVDSILIDEARTPLIIAGPATVSTHQYDKFKGGIEQLVRKQTMLCSRLVNEAKSLLDDGKIEEAGIMLFKVKLGQPRNKSLLRLLEDPVNRRALDKAELSFFQDSRKDELFALKEELFFTIDERAQEADLSEQGREFLNPDDAESFVLPDLMTSFAEIDIRTDLHRGSQGSGEGANSRPSATTRPSASTTFPNSCAPTAFTRRMSSTSSRRTRWSSSINTPAAKCRAAAGATACTRRSRPRKASRSTRKRRPSRRSPSRTISGFTRSSPA